MQESKGCVRAKSTSSPGDLIRNPGLMQVSTSWRVDMERERLGSKRALTCDADAQRYWKLQRRRRHGRSLSRQRNQTDDPRRLLRHRPRRRVEASVSSPDRTTTLPYPTLSLLNTDPPQTDTAKPTAPAPPNTTAPRECTTAAPSTPPATSAKAAARNATRPTLRIA